MSWFGVHYDATDGCTADEAWQNEIDLVLMGCDDLFGPLSVEIRHWVVI